MTYILNAIALGASTVVDVHVERVCAEPDRPPPAFLRIADQTFAGIRYLLVTDEGDGYMASNEFVDVPSRAELPARLSINQDLQPGLRQTLALLAESSPEARLAIYLEANRIISRGDPHDEHAPRVRVSPSRTLSAFWDVVLRRRIVEETIYIVSA